MFQRLVTATMEMNISNGKLNDMGISLSHNEITLYETIVTIPSD